MVVEFSPGESGDLTYLSRALSGGKGSCPSVSFSTKLVLVADFSTKTHLVHVFWVERIACGHPKEAQAEEYLILGCLLCVAMR